MGCGLSLHKNCPKNEGQSKREGDAPVADVVEEEAADAVGEMYSGLKRVKLDEEAAVDVAAVGGRDGSAFSARGLREAIAAGRKENRREQVR